MYSPEPLVRSVGVPPSRQQVSVSVADPGNLNNKLSKEMTQYNYSTADPGAIVTSGKGIKSEKI